MYYYKNRSAEIILLNGLNSLELCKIEETSMTVYMIDLE